MPNTIVSFVDFKPLKKESSLSMINQFVVIFGTYEPCWYSSWWAEVPRLTRGAMINQFMKEKSSNVKSVISRLLRKVIMKLNLNLYIWARNSHVRNVIIRQLRKVA